jgi:restriction endonuclease S subunit
MNLSDYVTIKSGRTFKSGITEHSDPTYKVIQLRDVDSKSIDWGRLVGVSIDTTRTVKTLQHGQILVVAKGPVKQAVLISNLPLENVVATQHFLVLTIKDAEALLPQFLVFYLNSEPVQQWINGNSGGSYQSSLSILNLSKLAFPSLTLAQQKLILDGVGSVEKEISLHELLIHERKVQLNEIAGALLIK